MTLDIDITDKRSHEIAEVMQNYPQGHLEIKFERVFWVSDSSGPISRGGPESFPGNRGTSNSVGDKFQRAADVLGGMMGPPPAPRQRQPPY